MISVLFVAFFLGMTHATEADHIAAVATLASQSGNARATLRTGLLWGLGHMLMLVFVGGIVLLVGTAIPEHIAAMLESVVGVMLIALGGDVLWRSCQAMVRAPASDAAARAHTRNHSHPLLPWRSHSHPHSGPDDIAHAHTHSRVRAHAFAPARPRWRPFVVGLVHGMAGSAALVVLAAGAAHEPAVGVAYIVIFGVGSLFGMVFVSLAMALPLHYLGRRLPRIAALTGAVTGVTSVVVGTIVVASSLPEALA